MENAAAHTEVVSPFMRPTKRQVIGLLTAPLLGAAAFVAWGWVFTRLRPTDVLPGPLSYQIRTGMPMGYLLALLATLPVIVVLTRRQWRDLKSYVGAGVIAALTLGLLLSLVETLFSETQDSALAAFWDGVPGSAIVFAIIVLPTVAVYWFAVERG